MRCSKYSESTKRGSTVLIQCVSVKFPLPPRPRSQARTAIAFKYDKQEAGEGGDSDIESQDERILAAYLREDEEEREKAFSSESEYGGWWRVAVCRQWSSFSRWSSALLRDL